MKNVHRARAGRPYNASHAYLDQPTALTSHGAVLARGQASMTSLPALNALFDQAWQTLVVYAHVDGFNAVLESLEDAPTRKVVFFSVTDGRRRARTVHGRGNSLADAWQAAMIALVNSGAPWHLAGVTRLRVDFMVNVRWMTWGERLGELQQTRRNYVEEGLALDEDFEVALLAQELHGNAILYNARFEHAQPRAVNLRVYGQRRFGREIGFPRNASARVACFTTRAVYVDATGARAVAGDHRVHHEWGAPQVRQLVDAGCDYLAAQVQPDGHYVYGRFPCFDRTVPGYNTLRHASSTYALLEAWEVTGSATQKAAIDRALARLTDGLILHMPLPDGTPAAFLIDGGGEIKLGGNAVSLLALVKHAELTGETTHHTLMTQLALGIGYMQDAASGRFVHVLSHPGLGTKDAFRTVYYDGEATFGLMRLYGLTRDPRWLALVEHAFDHFIEARHWEAHDHWLGYCVNELTRYRPDARYFEFGIRNVADHLDFVLERITTSPTLLELMMAAQTMLHRMEGDPSLTRLLRLLDRPKFERALEHRARYLANGHFGPELSMFFARPDRIDGAFFIRHHGFRVRIDDVEHYLSGYIAYLRYLEAGNLKTGFCAAVEPERALHANVGDDVNKVRLRVCRSKVGSLS